MTPPESTQVAVELERLRGAVDTGFATLNGRLDVALQRTDQTEKDISDLEQRLSALERARWPLPSVAALVSVLALGIAIYEALGK
ncbi:hypothetical protein ACNYS0_20875 [Streptomyces sp. BH034]|uniref:hypothetical protein n=1 Tax=Streptomyces sp. BH034 TaxID=3402626 RepID=UPI003BB6F8E9